MTSEELSGTIQVSPGGCTVVCHVQPNASKTAVAGLYGDALKLTLKTPPVDGKANKELCRFFADLAEIPAGSVKLLSGQTSRNKRVFVPVSAEILREKLAK